MTPISTERLDALGYLAAVGALVEEVLAVGVDVLDVYYGTAYGAALFDELDYFRLCLLRLVELAGSALEVVVLDVDDE